MLIGEYTLLIVDELGELLASHVIRGNSGHPSAGDYFRMEGKLYVMNRVEHEVDGDSLSSRTYSHAHVFVSEQSHSTGSRHGWPSSSPNGRNSAQGQRRGAARLRRD